MSDSPKRSRAATLARAFGIAGPALTIVGILLVQVGAAPMIGFGLFQLGILAGLVALISGGIGLYTTRGGLPGRPLAWLGGTLGVLMLLIVFFSAAPGAGVPPINDITTNLGDPPTFEPAAAGHKNADRDMTYPPEFAELARAAYPDLAPLELAVPADAAFAIALREASAQGWEVTRQDAIARTFEAEDTTALFRFVDDISVRVRATADGQSTVDIRSKSRDGRGDLGANANRIRAFNAGVAALPLRASPKL